MERYLAVYTGSQTSRGQSGWDALSEAERGRREEAGIKAWGDWMAANDATIVDAGGPLGKTKRVGPDGIADVSNALTGYVVLEAESHQAAAKLFENHPHFAIFPGEAVEIMPLLPIPGM